MVFPAFAATRSLAGGNCYDTGWWGRHLARSWRRNGKPNGQACISQAEVRVSTVPTEVRRLNGPLSKTGDMCTKSVQLSRVTFMSEVVLIVDDDPVQRRLLEAMVQRFGYEAMIADGGDAAITLLTGPRRAHRLRGPRPGDARSRRARRAGAHARRRPRYPGDRADRPWRHRQCGVGDARGRDRFRGQAGRPRAAAGLAAQRARRARRWQANCSGSSAAATARSPSPTSITRIGRACSRCCARPRRRPPPPFRC